MNEKKLWAIQFETAVNSWSFGIFRSKTTSVRLYLFDECNQTVPIIIMCNYNRDEQRFYVPEFRILKNNGKKDKTKIKTHQKQLVTAHE